MTSIIGEFGIIGSLLIGAFSVILIVNLLRAFRVLPEASADKAVQATTDAAIGVVKGTLKAIFWGVVLIFGFFLAIALLAS